MKEKQILYFALGVLSVVSIGAVTNQVLPVAPATSLTLADTGITFPDGTLQTTAAAPAITAWPMRCTDEEVAANGVFDDLSCASTLAVPGGAFNSSDGVPAGYYFVATDVLIEPNHGGLTSTGFVNATVVANNSSGVRVLNTQFKLSVDNESQLNSFTAPVFVLPEGHYLGAFNSPASTHSIGVTVTGYLTDQPEKLRL